MSMFRNIQLLDCCVCWGGGDREVKCIINIIDVCILCNYFVNRMYMYKFILQLIHYSSEDIISKIIKDNRVKYLPVDKEEYSRIIVRRRHLWGDALSCIKTLNENKYIRVTFVGEPAVDEGGPLREFFHLLTTDIAKRNMLFCGDESKRVPRHCMTELEKRTYYVVGKALALSIMHGGPAPGFFARSVFDYIAYGSTQARPDDVPDKAVRDSLMKVL